jgi:hypothetical protein
LGYSGTVSTQTALKLLYELRAVLDRLGESEVTLHETLVHDIDRAVRLTDHCITQLTEETPESDDVDDEDEE